MDGWVGLSFRGTGTTELLTLCYLRPACLTPSLTPGLACPVSQGPDPAPNPPSPKFLKQYPAPPGPISYHYCLSSQSATLPQAQGTSTASPDI